MQTKLEKEGMMIKLILHIDTKYEWTSHDAERALTPLSKAITALDNGTVLYIEIIPVEGLVPDAKINVDKD